VRDGVIIRTERFIRSSFANDVTERKKESANQKKVG
jgi:hypothetical protein